MRLQFSDPADIARLAEALRSASYNSSTLAEYIPWVTGANSPFRDAPSLLYSMRGRPKLHDICALFLLQLPLSLQAAQGSLEPASIAALLAAGLLRQAGDEVYAQFRIVPCLDFLVVSDLKIFEGGLPGDYVMGTSGSSAVLLNAAIRSPGRNALDLCAGSGIQALAAAAHSERVVALEKNQHAIVLGKFAAALNGKTNIEFRESDFYSAAEGELFDLILCNPPFVISPELQFQFRDGGMGGDRVSQHVVRHAPRFLNEGGFFQVICDVANYAGTSLEQHLAGWATGSGCDMVVMKGVSATMRDYPIGWLADDYHEEPKAYLEKHQKWVSYFEQEGIESMTVCVIALRRRTAPDNWVHVSSDLIDISRITGEDVSRLFAAVDYLRTSASDEALLSQHLVLNAGVRFDQRLLREGDSWALRECALAMADSRLKPMVTDPYIGGVCSRLDGTRPLRDIIGQLAQALHTEAERLAKQVVPVIRGLIERGYVDWK